MKKQFLHAIAIMALTVAAVSCNQGKAVNSGTKAAIDTVLTGTVTAELTDVPLVPKQLEYTSPKKVMVKLKIMKKL